MATVNEDLQDAAVSHQVGLIRYGTSIVKKIIALLERVDKDLARQIQRRAGETGTYSVARLDMLLKDIRQILSEGGAVMHTQLKTELAALATYEADFQARTLEKAIPVKFEVSKPRAQLLVAAVTSKPFKGALLKEWVDGLTAGQLRRLREAIRLGIAEGETVDQIMRRIRGTAAAGYKDGVFAISKRGAEAMVRTAVNHVATEAREILYDENADLIKGVRWVSTLDMRTTPICRARDGKVYKPNTGPRPPAHINCRSTTVPITKSWKELGLDIDEVPEGTRASMNGQVPASLTYDQWLRRQSKAVQNEILGPKRAALFRAGMPMEKFVTPQGKALTLAQLAGKDAETIAAKALQESDVAAQAKARAEAAAAAEAARVAREAAEKAAREAAEAERLRREAEERAAEEKRRLAFVASLQAKAKQWRAEFLEIAGTIDRIERLTPMKAPPTPKMTSAVRGYTASGYRQLNKDLRQGRPVSGHGREIKDGLDEAFAAGAKLDRDAVLYRNADSGDAAERIRRLKVGQSFQDDGFMSTSYRKGFAEGWDRNGVKMRIFARKGQPALLVDPISSSRGESEVLLPRGIRLRYLGWAPDGWHEFEIIG